MIYELHYQNQSIGTISNVGKDFPSYFGELSFKENWEELLDEDATNFVFLGLNRISEDHLTDGQYESLEHWILETENWSVIDLETKERIGILPPTIRPDYVAWRL